MSDRAWQGLARRWSGTAGEQRRGLVEPLDVRLVGIEESDGSALNVIGPVTSPAVVGNTPMVVLAPEVDCFVEYLWARASAGVARAVLLPPQALVALTDTLQRWLRLQGPRVAIASEPLLPPSGPVLDPPIEGRLLVPAGAWLLMWGTIGGSLTLERLALREAQ